MRAYFYLHLPCKREIYSWKCVPVSLWSVYIGALFYFFLVFAWLLPVYFSSEYVLDRESGSNFQEDEGPVAKTSFGRFFRTGMPLFLVLVCLLALGWAQNKAWVDLKGLASAFKEDRSALERTLPIPVVLLLIQATMLTAVLFLIPLANFALKIRMGPRYFFFSIGLAIAVLLVWFWRFEPQSELVKSLTPEEKDGFLVIGELPLMQWVRLCFPFAIALVWICIYAGYYRLQDRFPDREDLMVPTAIITVTVLVLLLFVDPLWLTRYGERALLVPLILGVWVPFFTGLSMAALRTGLPLTVALIVVISFFAMWNDAHVVRPTLQADGEQINLNAALTAWKTANGCANSADGAGCPRMLLVATQGGASRSAFFTGSVLGNMVDKNGTGSVKQIFAMSGVSGGSVGLAFFSAALRDRETSNGASPCRPTSTLKKAYGSAAFDTQSGFINWFGAPQFYGAEARPPSASPAAQTYVDTSKDYNRYWRNCLQVLSSGDFLSPVFLRMTGIDFLGLNRVFRSLGNTLSPAFGGVLSPDFGDKLARDRAKILEESWQRHYERIIGKDTLSRKFLDFGPDEKLGGEWRPLLILNATSTSTGRRVIASHLYPFYCDGNRWKRRIFNDAYDLHETFSARVTGTPEEAEYNLDNCTCVWDSDDKKSSHLECQRSDAKKYDFPLALAASLSARFPIVSPQADLKSAETDDILLGRIVDGGYFENHGATSLLELITAIRWLQAGAKLPIQILLITNDPTFENSDCLEGKVATEGDRPARLPNPPSYQFWSGTRSIVDAVLTTRSARGSNAAITLCKLQWTFDDIKFAHIGVRDLQNNVKDISMSWWLSYPVQLYLDSQLAQNQFPEQPKAFTEQVQTKLESNTAAFRRIEETLKKQH